MRLRGKRNRLLAWLEWPAAQSKLANRAAALQDYAVYTLSGRQFALATIVGCACTFAAAYLFYRSVIAAALFSTAGVVMPRFYRASLLERRRTRLALQFKEALYSLTSSLAAGRSVENAFSTALEDLRLLYPDPNAEVLIEFEIIRTRLSYGEPLEQSLADFGRRAAIDEITQFVDVFVTCKRTGGDLVEVIRRTSQTIGEKLDVQQEIAVLLAQKRYESRIMMGVPFVFLAFLGFAAPDYMAPLYGGIGYVLLTGALVMLGVCYWVMSKVMDIRM
ncbi:type II secretion system F family protein [Paenibacillus mendelii]|uniref:Type II secretion system F family protein n=1 Tax=Paenibacillus mendelii TaxID=206163 RepID=A0ABV6JJU9_9BACL|nr:type II secretion system F family protein [Paenibacillus mendelii]MCQ6559127.1 type II secretion system F family protein [Paenibacillus mendelii]